MSDLSQPASVNPKKFAGAKKVCLHYVPPIAEMQMARAMELGGIKYGPFNWQESEIDATTYYDAIRRHIAEWFTGQDIDPESGCSHLAHIMACCAVVIDAEATGMLIDDRPKTAEVHDFIHSKAQQRSTECPRPKSLSSWLPWLSKLLQSSKPEDLTGHRL